MPENWVNHRLFVRENKDVAFSGSTLEKIRSIIKRYPEGKEKSALLPVLHIAQEELGGYLSVDVMDHVATILNLQPIEVYEVATFYSMYFLDKRGKYVIEVCHTTPCSVCGGDELVEYLEQKLGIKRGETTADGLFTLRTVECLGGCGYAPVMQVDTAFHEQMTQEKVDRLIEDLKNQEKEYKETNIPWREEFC